MEVFGTLYGFLSVLAAVVGVVALVVIVTKMLISGRATMDLRGNKLALGQDRTNDVLQEIKEELRGMRAAVLEVQSGLCPVR